MKKTANQKCVISQVNGIVSINSAFSAVRNGVDSARLTIHWGARSTTTARRAAEHALKFWKKKEIWGLRSWFY